MIQFFSILTLPFLISLSGVSFATDERVETARLMTEELYEAPLGQRFDLPAYLRGELPANQYTNVIVVNKAAQGPGAQTARLYINRQLILTTPVSTGREDLEFVDTFEGFFRSVFGTKGAKSSHWRHTLRGYYAITRVEEADYKSSESKFKMPYAMFFNDQHGLALHQVPPDLLSGEAHGIAALGTRASSGCIRLGQMAVLQIHNAVVAAGQGTVPVIDSRSGRQILDQYGSPKFKSGWKTLVVVEEPFSY